METTDYIQNRINTNIRKFEGKRQIEPILKDPI